MILVERDHGLVEPEPASRDTSQNPLWPLSLISHQYRAHVIYINNHYKAKKYKNSSPYTRRTSCTRKMLKIIHTKLLKSHFYCKLTTQLNLTVVKIFWKFWNECIRGTITTFASGFALRVIYVKVCVSVQLFSR